MKRIDKIYNYVQSKCMDYKKEDLTENRGIDAIEISNNLDILRNNVSKELNELCRMRKLVKFKSRPVKYFDKKILEDILHISIDEETLDTEELENIINFSEPEEEKCPFDYLIGSKGSLKTQIEQAKAAILYPPNGLHTLIVGSTGVGKSLFANRMYAYGKYIKKFSDDAPFIVFNCADYYNNPQLLLSQLFGHSKGAFTGADTDKKGIVEKADGGVLFLDEIHRLPPEGQEMIFYFMDTGTFNKLGETERKRKANVLIIGATTEDPASTMLKTFIRRIPIIISIPNFEERSVEDKVDIIKELLHNEAVRINKPIKISGEAMKALIGSASFGNIGQLKSNIQLLCAKGFLNSINGNELIEISLEILPNNIRTGLINLSIKKKDNEKITRLLPSELSIYPRKKYFNLENDSYEPPFNIYKIIEDKSLILKSEGMTDEEIKKFITTDINVHIKCFYDNFKNNKYSKDKLLKIIDERMIKFSEEMKIYVEEKMGREYSDRFLYALSLHLSSLFNRINNIEYETNYSSMGEVMLTSPKEYEIAKEICKRVEEVFSINVPEQEIGYITLLITSIEEVKKVGKVGVVVIAHGSSTASSMAGVAIKLFESENIIAVDMPLDISPKDTLDVVKEKVREIDSGRGVILLVDMGSLNSFGNVIYEETGIRIKTLDMVSTPTVLEAARKSSLDDLNLDELYNYLKSFKGYNVQLEENKKVDKNRAIVTVCSSGMGTALKLKEIVENIVKDKSSEYIEILTTGIEDAKVNIKEIQKEKDVIAIVGSFNPELNIPFISLEKLISGEGENILESIFIGKRIVVDTEKNNIVMKKLCYDTLKETITYFNPDKIIGTLLKFINMLEKDLNKEYSNSTKLRIVMHVACALERVLIKDELKYSGEIELLDFNVVKILEKNLKLFEEAFNFKISIDEIYYMTEMLSY